jgi:predicted phosphodiesterase
MSDRHMHILRQVARQAQRELDHYDSVDHAGDASSKGRRDQLVRAAKRTRAQVTDAEMRRDRRDRDSRQELQADAPPLFRATVLETAASS